MTPNQAQVWTRYHKAADMLADAAEALAQANSIGDTVRYEQIVIGAIAEYRAARAALESL